LADERISICIPHWQVLRSMKLCLRSIRKHSRRYDLEVIVVDNGSKDQSLDYLRSLRWIKLIERPDETPDNWPRNVFTAWDRGLEDASGDYYLTMHSDVWVKSDDWLDPMLEAMRRDDNVAAAGSWKLTLEPRLYAWQKQFVGNLIASVKHALGRKPHSQWGAKHFPRDYCALYRMGVLRDANLQFLPVDGFGGGGHSIAKLIENAGYDLHVVPVSEMARRVVHVAHGTAALSPHTVNRRSSHVKAKRRTAALLKQFWVRELEADDSLDK